jgi:hypothetical protein
MQKAAAERLRELEPNLGLSNLHRRSYPMKRSDDFVRLKEGLGLAGFQSEARVGHRSEIANITVYLASILPVSLQGSIHVIDRGVAEVMPNASMRH